MLIKEIEQKSINFKNHISTIYFGGGTPSLMNNDELLWVIDVIQKNYSVSENIEFTLECNPDDLSKQKLIELKNAGVNRLSIGTQSFYDEDLQLFNRAHTANVAEKSIKMSQDAGFENITIDLIYGMPTLTQQRWENNLKKFMDLNLPHLSAYSLTIEPKTTLNYQVRNKLLKLTQDKEILQQFTTLMEIAKQNKLEHYEISNFAKEGFISQHNSNYWKGEEYLGFGPSAHSYVDNKRYWNVANNVKYIKAIKNKEVFFEEEIIDEPTAFNEYVLTRLRTMWGVDLNDVQNNFGEKYLHHLNKEAETYFKNGCLQKIKDIITLTKKGIFIADKISSDLFILS